MFLQYRRNIDCLEIQHIATRVGLGDKSPVHISIVLLGKTHFQIFHLKKEKKEKKKPYLCPICFICFSAATMKDQKRSFVICIVLLFRVFIIISTFYLHGIAVRLHCGYSKLAILNHLTNLIVEKTNTNHNPFLV